jgi:hypothetical protein
VRITIAVDRSRGSEFRMNVRGQRNAAPLLVYRLDPEIGCGFLLSWCRQYKSRGTCGACKLRDRFVGRDPVDGRVQRHQPVSAEAIGLSEIAPCGRLTVELEAAEMLVVSCRIAHDDLVALDLNVTAPLAEQPLGVRQKASIKRVLGEHAGHTRTRTR